MNTFYEHREDKLFIGEMTHYAFPPHVHEVAEIVVLTSGSAKLNIDGIEYILFPGDAAVIFPLVPHSYEQLSENIGGIAAIFPPDVIPEYAGTFHGLAPENPILRADRIAEDTQHAVVRLGVLSMDDDLPLCVAYLHVLLAGILHRLSYQPVYDYSEQNLGHRIMRYVSDHACEEITLDSVSHALGISTSHLSHFFAEKLHINFRHFINASRISGARLLMRDPNMTLTEVSDACGYTNMRTFRRAFLKEVGCLPSEHMQALRTHVTMNRSETGES